MALNLEQQIKEAINRSRQILVTFRQNADADAIAAALALTNILQKQGKQVEVASDSFNPASTLNFLPQIKDIKPSLSPVQKFIIKVDVSKNKLDSLSYDVKNGQLYIYITPREGLINREDVKTAATDLKFDLIFILDSPDLESLGRIYDNNTDLFFRTPTVNIDHNPANEHFGKINLVDLSATSTSEIVFELLTQLAPDQIKAEIATLLLTGMIAKTRSFKTANVNARTLQNAGKLVDLGAEREKIVQNLFRNRSLATLKLWGQALTHLKNDPAIAGLVWLTLSREDFQRAGANEENLPEIIDELLANAPEAKIIVLLYETEKTLNGQLTKQIEGLVVTHQNLDAKLLTKPFNPEGTSQRVKIVIKDKDLVAAEKEVAEKIREAIKISPKI